MKKLNFNRKRKDLEILNKKTWKLYQKKIVDIVL